MKKHITNDLMNNLLATLMSTDGTMSCMNYSMDPHTLMSLLYTNVREQKYGSMCISLCVILVSSFSLVLNLSYEHQYSNLSYSCGCSSRDLRSQEWPLRGGSKKSPQNILSKLSSSFHSTRPLPVRSHNVSSALSRHG